MVNGKVSSVKKSPKALRLTGTSISAFNLITAKFCKQF